MADRSDTLVVRAAGAVLWRCREDAATAGDQGARDLLEVALVHRPKYDDWSLPKGKLLAAEHPLVAAAREVAEETGFSAVAGRPLGVLRYPVDADGVIADKVVRYWAMRAAGGAFSPCDEVDEMVWLSPPKAINKLSYRHDRGPLRRFLDGPYQTTTILLIRHARAGQRSAWRGPDRLRPLEEVGRAQADALRVVAPCFGPKRIISADLARCTETVAPLAERLGISVEVDPVFDESAHAEDPTRSARRLRDLARAGHPVVVCSQGGVIPDVVGTLAAADGVRLEGKLTARKGSLWALSFADSRLVDTEYFPTL